MIISPLNIINNSSVQNRDYTDRTLLARYFIGRDDLFLYRYFNFPLGTSSVYEYCSTLLYLPVFTFEFTHRDRSRGQFYKISFNKILHLGLNAYHHFFLLYFVSLQNNFFLSLTILLIVDSDNL